MHAERLVKILANNPNPDPSETELARALVMSDNPPRDLEAEAELSRALARNGGDGLTACGEDAGLCPKPRLRHRRVNAGVWPNWRCVYVEWAVIGSRLCRAQDFTGRYPFSTCGTHQDHLKTIERKERLIAFVKAQQQGACIRLPEATHMIDSTPNGAEGAFGALLDSMVRQARNISDSMGISPIWNRESSEIIIGPEPMQWAVSSNIPRLFEGRTYRFDFIDPSPAEPLPASALPLVEALVSHPQPSQDSEASTSLPAPEPTQGHPTTPAPPQSSPSRSS